MSSRFDVVLIGSGISSLTCAALLAKKGKSVCVVERYKKPGGYLHGFKRFGHHFDTGAHYIGAMNEGQPFRQLLEYVGVFESELFAPLDSQGFDIMEFPDLKVTFPQGYEAVIASLTESFPGEAKGIRGFFNEIELSASQFQTYKFREKVDQNLLNRYIELTLAKVVESHTQNDNLKAVLYSHCLLHGVHPNDVAFGMHSIMMDSFITGAVGFAKGGDAFAQKFVQVIEAQGGKVDFRKEVIAFQNEGDEIKSIVCADGEAIEGDWYVSGIHLKKTFELLSDPSVLKPAFKDRLGSLTESMGTFAVYAVCKKPLTLNPRKNYFLFDQKGTEGGLFKIPDVPSPPHTVFATSNRVPDPQSETCAVKFLAVTPYNWVSKWENSKVGHRGEEYDNFKKSYSEMIWNQVGRYFPDLKALRENEVTSSPLSNIYFNGAPEGSGYGLYHSQAVTGPRAIGPRTHLKNLLVTGQSTLFPGFLGAATAGVRTAGHILGIKELLSEIQSGIK